MDAKSKANFINSIAGGQIVPCPNCNAANNPDSKHCVACGTALTAPAAVSGAPAFAAIDEKTAPANVMNITEESAFAQGLPAWDIVPPQVMVRRR